MATPIVQDLTPETVLHRAARLTVHVGSANEVRIETGGGRAVDGGVRALAVLDAFRHPTTMQAALDELRSRITGAEEFMSVSATILAFVQQGLLRPETDGDRVMAAEQGWANPSIHVQMLNDRARTGAYLAAIERVVGPDDVVLDLGTGTGVLAVAAARAGARHVYAIEASGIGRVAQQVFRANGVEDRITLLQGWSSTLSLPEPATVLVSEIIGHDPLDEGVLEHTLDARARLLAPGARLLPRALRVRAYGVRLSPEEAARSTPSAAARSDWRSWYGIDLGPLGEARRHLPFVTTVRPERAADWEAVTDPVDLLSVDLATFDELAVETVATTAARSSGPLHGVLVFAEIELDDDATVSTRPPGPSLARTSWRNVAWLMPEALDANEGDTIEIVYRYRSAGEPALELAVRR